MRKISGIAIALSLTLGYASNSFAADVDSQPVGINSVAASSVVDVPVFSTPAGVVFASVEANGTGCAPGTWTTDIASDGLAFTLAFSSYEAIVNPGSLISAKDCLIAVKLHNPQGLSFSVSDFFYSGYAFLEKTGMKATQTAGYYFQGNPVKKVSARTDLSGPFDDLYIFEDQIGIADLVWSPCGADRTLNIPTTLTLKNNFQKTGTGYLNTMSVDAQLVVQFVLSWQTCTP